jgi:hypothetical protein
MAGCSGAWEVIEKIKGKLWIIRLNGNDVTYATSKKTLKERMASYDLKLHKVV